MKRTFITAFSLLATLAIHHVDSKSPAGTSVLGNEMPQQGISGYGTPRHETVSSVRIRIVKNAQHCVLETRGRYQLCNPATGMPMTSALSGKRAPLLMTTAGMNWGKDVTGFQKLRIIPADTASSVLVDGIQYRGLLDIYNISGKIHIVNEVDVEQYLSSSLIPLDEPHSREVLECIAILARTHALYLTEKTDSSALWHIDGDAFGYRGYGAAFLYPEIDDAIARTKGTILTYKDHPFACSWTENCAGKTADYATIYRVDALSTPAATSPIALRERQNHRWTTSISKLELGRKLQLPSAQDMELFLDRSTSKVYAVRIKGGHSMREINFLTFQTLVGKEKLPSNDFQVKILPDRFEFEGFGKGSGVGLCLFSAEQMRMRAQTSSQILSTFFPGSKIINLIYPNTQHVEEK